MNIQDIFNENTINIFTDGSILNKDSTGETIGCPGAILVRTNKRYSYMDKETVEIVRNTTNNNTEIRAILLGLRLLYGNLDFSKPLPRINLFSDSKICVFGLREWIYNWVNCNINGVMYNSSGVEVANQEIFKYIILMILKNNIPIKLYHQKGHVNVNSEKYINKAIQTFNVSNYCRTSDIELIVEISTYNNYIDNLTRDYLHKMNYEGHFREKHPDIINPLRFNLEQGNMSVYKKLTK